MIEQQLDSLLEDIKYEISLLSNAAAFIFETFDDISWAGFYLNQDDHLILGPFQGKTACTIIPYDRGVCGACATNQKVYRVSNVHEFPGHIACDSASNSEIVLPMIIDNQLFGVLDIDSTSLDRFDEADEKLLGKLTDIIIKHLKRLKK